jgi:Protein of unknown function (DUF1697)
MLLLRMQVLFMCEYSDIICILPQPSNSQSLPSRQAFFLPFFSNRVYTVTMHTYISMLRGINVSGQKQVRMTELKSLYESLGLENVRTYVQSGNVVFASAQS